MVQDNRFSLVFADETHSYRVFSEPEGILYKKINISVLKTITIYLEDDNQQEVNSNGETLTFTFQLIKIWVIKWAFKNLKVVFFVSEAGIFYRSHLWRYN